jgi:hypothetical protein
MTHPDAGRNDHIHGDENYRDAEPVDLYDVIFAIDKGASTHDGLSHYDWIRRICDGDEIVTIIQHIIKNRHKPEFGEIMNELEISIEGWL